MKLSIKECLSFGWNTFKKRPWIFVKAAFVLFFVSFAFNLVSSFLNVGVQMNAENALALVFGILLLAITIIGAYVSIVLNYMGVTKFYLKAHDSVETLRLKDLWTPHPFVKYVLTALLFGVVFVVGLILLIIPGVIVSLVFGMALYLVMDRGLGPIEAMKESARITRGNRWRLFVLGLAILGINILGMIVLLVGLFVSIPVSILAMMHAYRTLSQTPVAPV